MFPLTSLPRTIPNIFLNTHWLAKSPHHLTLALNRNKIGPFVKSDEGKYISKILTNENSFRFNYEILTSIQEFIKLDF